ncbi:aspartate-alanine antiporter-like transporter [Streptacidiphilus sp. PAMC 29251]
MRQFLIDYPYVTLFGVIALGSLLGLVRFGPVRLGAAGVLFAGLAVGALDKGIGPAVPTALSVEGLALYVYTVGLESGPAFFREVGRQLPVMLGAVVALVLTALAVGWGGHALFGISGPYLAGGYAGIGTTTPGLAAAQAAAKDPTQPAVGYAIGYPLAIIVTILFLSVLARRRPWTARRDPGDGLPDRLATVTVTVERGVRLREVPGVATGRLLVSAHQPVGGETAVALGLDLLHPGEQVVLVGGEEDVAIGVAFLGARSPHHLLDDRERVDYRRILLTNPKLAGHTVAELGLGEHFGARASRLRRGDVDLLVHDDLVVQLDDRIRVVAPRGEADGITRYLGDAEGAASEVSAVSLGLGLCLGFLIGIPSVTFGSTRLALGAAAGPLLMGMFLGWRRRTGPLVWTLPTRANLTLRQIGLLLFLAIVGLTSGYAFRVNAFSLFGLKLLALLLIGAVLSYSLLLLVCRLLGQSRERSMGLLAGYVGNPALTAHANAQVRDSRINTGYSTLFALAILVKIICIQLIVGL